MMMVGEGVRGERKIDRKKNSREPGYWVAYPVQPPPPKKKTETFVTSATGTKGKSLALQARRHI